MTNDSHVKLEGRVAIVTGGAGGIGQAIVHHLASDGADVAVADVSAGPGTAVVEAVRLLGRRALFVKTDVRESREVEAMVASVLRDLGRIDVLVNCAGGSARGDSRLFQESSEETWDNVIALNLKGVRNCCRAVIGHMLERRNGKIVNIASTAATAALLRIADYSAAKAGVIALTRVLAAEVAQYGVNVNCVSPGPTETAKPLRSNSTPIDQQIRLTGLGRMARPQEIANVVAFLVSDDASFVTGQNYDVCGLANLVRSDA